MEQEIIKIEGITPNMVWIALAVGVALLTLYVLYGKARQTYRDEKKAKKKEEQETQLQDIDITDKIAEKVIQKLTPQIDEKFKEFSKSFDEKFKDIDEKLANDNESIKSHTSQLNDHETRVGRLEGGNRSLCQGMLALLEQNPLLGRQTKAMQNYLITGKYNEDDWRANERAD